MAELRPRHLARDLTLVVGANWSAPKLTVGVTDADPELPLDLKTSRLSAGRCRRSAKSSVATTGPLPFGCEQGAIVHRSSGEQ